MKLPNVADAVIAEEKIIDYLLNLQHPDGAGKAKFFLELGFVAEAWSVLAAALQRIAVECEVIRSVDSVHGQKYTIDGRIETPCGQRPRVRTVWIVDLGALAPRLVTAHPLDKDDSND